MKDRQVALDLAAGHAARWLGSLGTRPVPPRASVAEVAEALGPRLPDGPTPAPRGHRPAGERLRARTDRDAVGPVLRDGSSAARTRQRSAADWLVSAWDQNAGAAPGHPGARGGRGRRGHVAARPARPAGRQRRRLRHRRAPCRTSPAWPPRGTRCCAGPAGTSHATGWTARRRSACSSVSERHDTVDLALRYLGPRRAGAGGRRRPGPDPRRRPGGRAGRAATAPGDRRACRRATCTPVRSTRSARRSTLAHEHGRLGARRRRVRPVGRRIAADRPPDRRARARRLVGHRRAQDAQRALRLRHRDRRATAPRCAPPWACTATT